MNNLRITIMTTSTKSHRILCFGDSITGGWSYPTDFPHAYDVVLLEHLEKAFPSIKFDKDVQGLPGDQVVTPPGGFVTRMDILYEDPDPSYTLAIILGGTNDLGGGRSAKDIFLHLQKTYAIPLANNTKVLALTVIENAHNKDMLETNRLNLNKKILGLKDENLYTFDLAAAFPYESLSAEKRKELWADGVHPTGKGYDVIGEVLAPKVIEIIKEFDVKTK